METGFGGDGDGAMNWVIYIVRGFLLVLLCVCVSVEMRVCILFTPITDILN